MQRILSSFVSLRLKLFSSKKISIQEKYRDFLLLILLVALCYFWIFTVDIFPSKTICIIYTPFGREEMSIVLLNGMPLSVFFNEPITSLQVINMSRHFSGTGGFDR